MAWTGPIENVEFSSATSGGTFTFQPAATIPIGSLIVIGITGNVQTTPSTASDNASGTANTYVAATPLPTGTSMFGAVIYCLSTARAITHTNTISIVMNANCTRRDARMLTFTGQTGFDQAVAEAQVTTSPINIGPTGTLAGSNELALAFSFWLGGATTTACSVGAGYTLAATAAGSGGVTSRVECNVSYKKTAGTAAESNLHAFGSVTRAIGQMIVFKGVSGTLHTQSVSSALRFAGSAPKKASTRKLPGALSFSGARTASPKARLVAGAFQPAGSVSRTLSLARRITGALSFSGAQSRSTMRTLPAAGFTPTGVRTSIKAVSQAVSGALTFSGSQSRFPSKMLAASLAPSGVLSRAMSLGRTLTGVFSATTRGGIGAIIPAYSYPSPTTVWDAWISGAPFVKMMIADPGSPGGPGTFTDSNYVAAFAHAQANGIRILGYVDTSFATIPLATVESQVDAWFTLYGIRDIFFDNANSSATQLPYYQSLGDYVHGASGGAQVMLNHGTNPDEGYFNGMADVVCTFEGSQSDYDAYAPPSFIEKYPPSMVAQLVYDVPAATQMDADFNKAIRCNAGYAYITDDTLAAFPWDTAPSYWSVEYNIGSSALNRVTSRSVAGVLRPAVFFNVGSKFSRLTGAVGFHGAVTHGLPAKTFFAVLAPAGSIAKNTSRLLVSSLIAAGALRSTYIPVNPPGIPGGGGHGALMGSRFFQRYEVAGKWRDVKRVKFK